MIFFSFSFSLFLFSPPLLRLQLIVQREGKKISAYVCSCKWIWRNILSQLYRHTRACRVERKILRWNEKHVWFGLQQGRWRIAKRPWANGRISHNHFDDDDNDDVITFVFSFSCDKFSTVKIKIQRMVGTTIIQSSALMKGFRGRCLYTRGDRSNVKIVQPCPTTLKNMSIRCNYHQQRSGNANIRHQTSGEWSHLFQRKDRSWR